MNCLNTKEKTLEFNVNDESQGIAFKGINTPMIIQLCLHYIKSFIKYQSECEDNKTCN